MAYAVARFAGTKHDQAIGLVGILAFQIVTLVTDSATGLGPLAVSLPVNALFSWIGTFVKSRADNSAIAPTPAVEPAPI